jgi:hypothetical protein
MTLPDCRQEPCRDPNKKAWEWQERIVVRETTQTGAESKKATIEQVKQSQNNHGRYVISHNKFELRAFASRTAGPAVSRKPASSRQKLSFDS